MISTSNINIITFQNLPSYMAVVGNHWILLATNDIDVVVHHSSSMLEPCFPEEKENKVNSHGRAHEQGQTVETCCAETSINH